jgi:hypothetical protein
MRSVYLLALTMISTAAISAEPIKPLAAKVSDKLICETQEITGSRLGGRRVCMTRAQWDESRQRDRQEIERGQRTQTNPTD